MQLSVMPSLKEKKRYVAYEASETIDHNEVLNQCNSHLGIFDGAQAGLQLITTNGNKGIIRVTTTHVDKLKASLALISNIHNKKVMIKTTNVSGILEKAKQTIG
jgi:RNase P/RNase MRP subunit POP5